ncbi:MAG: DUF58 domain-containing protein [Flavobacteriales bacterium]
MINLDDLNKFGSLEILAKQVVEGFITGLHKSPFHGFSVEFAEHRLYNTGESTRNIDWKLYARTDKLFVKRYEEETNLRCQILLDFSSSMYFPEKPKKGQLRKIEFSCFAAAAIISLLQRQRDAVGLSTFASNVEEHTECKSGITHVKRLYHILESYLDRQAETRATRVVEALHAISDQIHRRSLVVIFSDMFEAYEGADRDAVFSALQHLRYNKHEVILFHVMDKNIELELNLDNRPYKFIDLESGEVVKLNPSNIRQEYSGKMHAFQKELEYRCGQYRIDFVNVDVNENLDNILLSYLIKRAKMH